MDREAVRQVASSGSPLEPQIRFSRAVRAGSFVAVAGTAPWLVEVEVDAVIGGGPS
ncbi:hypothetical protein [Streptomyces sp. 2112.3]|uniref:hypothetical protein n=1 Tax=Streptomyces sp. 2112.3 TaxID=1881023 RepID=UPI0015A6B1F5|nr:hypothetical protein [Streptomyces sp. 2112.3]